MHASDNSCYKEHLTTRLFRSLYTAFSFTTEKHIKLFRLEFMSVSNTERNVFSAYCTDTALSSTGASKRTHLCQPASPTAFETQVYPKAPVQTTRLSPPFFSLFFCFRQCTWKMGKPLDSTETQKFYYR